MQNNTNIRLSIGTKLIIIDTLPSTNDYLKEQIANFKPLEEGTAIMARAQTRGRGQRGNQWNVEASKNLTFSFVLYPSFLDVHSQFYLTVFVSLAISTWLKKFCDNVKIKWPNDIMIGDKKICGILIENSIGGKNIKSSIIGIGLNINQTNFEEPLQKATSLRLETGAIAEFSVEIVLKEILQALSEEYYKLTSSEKKSLLRKYNDQLYRGKEKFNYIIDNEVVDGVICAVEEDGLLQLKVDEEVRKFAFKEVKYVI